MRSLRLILLAAAASAALLAPSSAHAQIGDVSVSDARLGPDGASLTLFVSVTCEPGYTIVGALADVVQRKGNRLISGSGGSFPFPAPTCTGAPQTLEVAVTNFGPFRFQNGKGTANVLVGVSGPTGLVLESFGPFEIRIHKK